MNTTFQQEAMIPAFALPPTCTHTENIISMAYGLALYSKEAYLSL